MSSTAEPENAGWEVVSSETQFSNEHLTVATEKIRTPSRRAPRPWTVVHRKRAVVIAPITASGEIVLIRQERLPVRSTLWEVPAGQIDEIDGPDMKAIEAVALRELREETGYELTADGVLIPLGDYFTSPGFTDEQGYLFLARPVQLGASGHAHDESESILDCRAFGPGQLIRMIAENQICNANTLSICAHLFALKLPNHPFTPFLAL